MTVDYQEYYVILDDETKNGGYDKAVELVIKQIRMNILAMDVLDEDGNINKEKSDKKVTIKDVSCISEDVIGIELLKNMNDGFKNVKN